MKTPHFDIIRVFPRQTSYTPDDDMAFIGMPTLFIPEHKEVHISCTFTWDRKYCEELAYQWEGVTNRPVKLGGVAYGSDCSDFVQGLYVKSNIIFTSRGCNNNCPWCVVPKNEGRLKQLEIVPGNWIQDNNFLQCDRHHKDINHSSKARLPKAKSKCRLWLICWEVRDNG